MSPKKDDKPGLVLNLGPRIINGGIAGMVGVTATFPIDLVKTRLQTQTVGPNGEKMYTSVVDCFAKVIKHEGFFGMYRGSAVVLVLITPEKALKLVANDFFRYHLRTNDPVLPLPRQMMAGAGAGFLQITISTPMELLKIQLQDAGRKRAEAEAAGKKFKNPSIVGAAKKIFKQKGITGLYRGYLATASRDVTFNIIYFPLFFNLNELGPRKKGESGEAVFWWSLLCGIVSGALSAFCVTPMDCVKTRLQTDAASNHPKYNNAIDCIGKTLKNEGLRALFKGGACRMAVMAPLFGILQAIYYMGIGEYIWGVKQVKNV